MNDDEMKRYPNVCITEMDKSNDGCFDFSAIENE